MHLALKDVNIPNPSHNPKIKDLVEANAEYLSIFCDSFQKSVTKKPLEYLLKHATITDETWIECFYQIPNDHKKSLAEFYLDNDQSNQAITLMATIFANENNTEMIQNDQTNSFYKEYVLEYGERVDYELLDTVYNFTSDDLKWNIENSEFSVGVEYIASRIQWDPSLIFLIANNDQGFDYQVIFLFGEKNKQKNLLTLI